MLRSRTEPPKPSELADRVSPVDRDQLRAVRQLVCEQESLLLSIASGLSRREDLDDDFRRRTYAIRRALRTLGLSDPFPVASLAVWVAECSVRPLRYEERKRQLAASSAPVLQRLDDFING